jgi:DNA-directed RNA polymerase specialized sigma24 family protein
LVELAGVSRPSSDPIELSEDERRELEAISGRLTAPFRMVQRARIVLYAAQGLTNVEIARRLDTAPEVVAKWRRRFRLERLQGLQDRARSGRPRRFPPAAGRRGQGDRLSVAGGAGRSAVAVLAR